MDCVGDAIIWIRKPFMCVKCFLCVGQDLLRGFKLFTWVIFVWVYFPGKFFKANLFMLGA